MTSDQKTSLVSITLSIQSTTLIEKTMKEENRNKSNVIDTIIKKHYGVMK